MPTGVLMHSIGENNTTSIAYHIFVNESFDAKNRNLLSDIAGRYGSDVNFYTITEETTKDFPLSGDNRPDHVTMASYYRLFAADVLPENLDKVLYLDGDMIVRKPLDELWDTDIEGYAVGVTQAKKAIIIDEHHLPYDMDNLGYFNAGMLLINLSYWRQNRLMEQFMQFIQDYADVIKWHDQDVLNVVLGQQKKTLSLKYNFENDYLRKEWVDSYIHPNDCYEECSTSPTIIHYTGIPKPWHQPCQHPFREEWKKYADQSIWKGFKRRKAPKKKGHNPFSFDDIKYVFKMPGLPPVSTVKYWKIVVGNLLYMYGIGKKEWEDRFIDIHLED